MGRDWIPQSSLARRFPPIQYVAGLQLCLRSRFFIIAGTTHLSARALPRNHADHIFHGRPRWSRSVAGGILGGLGVCFRPTRVAAGWGLNRVTCRGFPREHSGALDRHGFRRSRSAHLDALGAAALSTAVHRLDLSRLFKDEMTSRPTAPGSSTRLTAAALRG